MQIEAKKPSIVSLGEVLWDLFPDGDRFGGASANFACHAAILGGQVAMFSAVGQDERGDQALKILQCKGVDVSLVQRISDAPTGTVGVSLDQSGKPTFVIHPGSAWDRMVWTSEMQARLLRSDTVYFGTLGQREPIAKETIRRALNVARDAGIRRVLDVNLRSPFYDEPMIRESIGLATVLKLSDDELPTVLEACQVRPSSSVENTLQELRRRFQLDIVAMTRGAHGAMLVTELETVDQPAIETKVVDTVGAGDAFTAAFVIGLHSGADMRSLALNACSVASSACSYAGAIPL